MTDGNTYPITFAMQVEGDAEVQSKMHKTADAVEDVGEVTEKTASRTSRFTGALKESALGLTSAATGAVGLYFQFDNLEKVSTRVDKAEKSLTTSQSALISAQERVNKLAAEGVTSGAAYEKAQLDLQAAQQGVTIATDKLSQAQGDLTQSQLQFALQVVPTTINTVGTLSTVIQGLRAAKLSSIVATEGEAVANASAAASTVGLTAASAGATIATAELSLAQRALQIAMGPVGWIVLGISGAMALFATNAFGVRDAVNAAGKAIGDAVPIMRPLLDGLSAIAKAIFPEAQDASNNFSGALSSDADQVKKQFSVLSNEASINLGDMSEAFSGATSSSSTQINKLSSTVSTAADRIVSDANRIESAMKKIGVKSVGGAFALEGTPAPNMHSSGISDTFTRALADPQAFAAASGSASGNPTFQRAPLFDVNRSQGDQILSVAAKNSKMTFELKIDPNTKEILLEAVSSAKGNVNNLM